MLLAVPSTLTKTNRINKLRDGAFENNFLSLGEKNVHITAGRARKQTSILNDANILYLIEIYIHFFLRRTKEQNRWKMELGIIIPHCLQPHSTGIMHCVLHI